MSVAENARTCSETSNLERTTQRALSTCSAPSGDILFFHRSHKSSRTGQGGHQQGLEVAEHLVLQVCLMLSSNPCSPRNTVMGWDSG